MAATDTPPRTAVVDHGDDNGGALASRVPDTLPPGVTAHLVTHYRVGQYTYTNLDDALAEHRRQTPAKEA